MTIGDRIQNLEANVTLLRLVLLGAPHAEDKFFLTYEEIHASLESIVSHVADDLQWLSAAVPEQIRRRPALTDDERQELLRRIGAR